MADMEDVLPTSAVQQGLLFHALEAPGSGLYTEQLVWELSGELDVVRLAGAWRDMVGRHAALRTTFHWQQTDEPVQVVHRVVDSTMAVIEHLGTDEGTEGALLDGLLADDRSRPFDLDRPPLVRLTLVRLGPRRHWMLWSFHHAILDGWSVGHLCQELVAGYQWRGNGVADHPPERRPYRDFVAWMAARDPGPGRRFWKSHMEGFSTPARFPAGFRPDPGGGPGTFEAALSEGETAALRRSARHRRLTLNTLVCWSAPTPARRTWSSA